MARLPHEKHKKGKLLASWKRAIDAYMENGGNKRQALLTAGFGETTAHGNPASVFNKPEVIEEIRRRKQLLEITYELTEDWVIQRLMRLANSGEILAPFRKKHRDGSLYWDFTDATEQELSVISGMTVDTYVEGKGAEAQTVKKFKIDVPDPKGALDSLARKLGMFKDNVAVTGELSLIERIQRGRERANSGSSKP